MTVVLGRKPGGAGGGGGPPTGNAGGDLAGSYPNPTLAPGTVLFDAYAILADHKAANTAGGTFTSGAWRTRDLNTEVADPAGIVSISANQFTLQAGAYWIEAVCPASLTDAHKCKLRNITDSTDDIIGNSMIAQSNTGTYSPASTLSGRVVIAGAKVFEVQHRAQTTSVNANGFGAPSNFGVAEVYTVVKIFREA